MRIIAVEELTDALYRDVLEETGTENDPHPVLQPVTAAAQAVLPLLHVTWRATDALTFPLCLSTESPETGPLEHVSIARGNIVLCDHGRTVVDELPPPVLDGSRSGVLELPLPRAPISFAADPPGPEPSPSRSSCSTRSARISAASPRRTPARP